MEVLFFYTMADFSALDKLDLKAFFFDMDGVLFDSMPNHAKAWCTAFEDLGIHFTPYDAYMREGMTGTSTIYQAFTRQLGRDASEEECKRIYKVKCEIFESLPEAKPMPHVLEVLQTVQRAGLDIYIVTGSGQHSLFDRLNTHFPNIFSREKMVTAYDVKKGKPDPEPYLMALKKGNFKADQAIVIENAPLGVKSAVDAGIFTIAVNTGILKDEELSKNGADVIYHTMEELLSNLPEIIAKAKK
ncbi:MAG: HAD-IA family hydrolase [Paludibacteraceae bacterium]|nr:HAD-IA family hydrolase [Paludibacteraceae bacterium]